MRKNLLKVGLISVFAAGLASCGGEEAQPLTAANASVVLTQLNTVLGQLPRSTTAPTLPITGATTAAAKPGVSTMAAIDCETVTPTTPVDADGDGIAATKTGTFDCTSNPVGQYTYTRKGSYTIKDLDDTTDWPVGGMSATFDVDSFNYTKTDGETGSGSHNGTWKFIGESTGAMTSTANYTGRYAFTGAASDYNIDYTYSYTWDWAMTPDSTVPANAFNSGSQTFKGEFSLNGLFVTERNGVHTQGNGSFRVTYQSKNLLYDTTCAKYYKSGSIMMDDSNGTSIEVRYACSTAELYVNGAKSDWWTP
jgi:hypothetical protein